MKKIMFSDKYGLTQAVLDGWKTMTRRIVPRDFFTLQWDEREDTLVYENDMGDFIDVRESSYSRYKVGEVVAIAQQYCDIVDKSKELRDVILDEIGVPTREYEAGFYNKMFVKSELMPHHIRITDVRIERLQDISDDDCLKEGIWEANNVGFEDVAYWYHGLINSTFRTAREAFAALIDKVSGKGVWESNPYVFVYEFELVD